MSSVAIKVCGITNLADALTCVEAGADYLGFVFYRPSPRYLPPAAARGIVERLPGSVTAVGIFVDEPDGSLEAAVLASGVGLVQLCGAETPDQCRRSPRPVIKSFRASAPPPAPHAAYPVYALMADGGGPGVYGGSGLPAEDDFARALSRAGRLFLAGGLDPGNVASRIAAIRPFGVDVCGGTEKRPGTKDPALVRAFCASVRSTTT